MALQPGRGPLGAALSVTATVNLRSLAEVPNHGRGHHTRGLLSVVKFGARQQLWPQEPATPMNSG